eukprot:TRINITY_DN80405_c0_g1_i1.p1 TRINITY_DN80405_c0_g1~~TRINITY_DN80405_c0_g1_i1.p1  ORF type:complete len:1081 (+),score=294.43 TRINITY_DN80405_c0_g1_i1:86-3328(+)
MLSNDDPFSSNFGGGFGATPSLSTASAGSPGPWIGVRIARTEEQTSVLMQRFTAYVVEVSDFGRTFEVPHRYGDFEGLHKALLAECPGLNLPPLPPKGVDGTDMAVVSMRKVELEKILKFILSCPAALMEKSLNVFKFLNLPNPAVIAGRFVSVAGSRATTIKTLSKLTDPKYKDDVYRLGHPSMTELLMEGLRELGRGSPESNHWSWKDGGRAAICSLLAAALGVSEAVRTRLLDADVIGLLLGIVEREEEALDDARTALNVIVAREADRFPSLMASFVTRGGLNQLMTLALRSKSQEFVAKLLWLAWDAPTRAPFAQPGGQGLRLLQALMKSTTPTCSLLGAVLFCGLVASGDFDSDPGHRHEALNMVRTVLCRPDANGATDPAFSKALCGSNAALVRLASFLEDTDLAPLVLGLLCAAKPPAAKLQRIAGNLAALVGDKGGAHSEETRARAAELLLDIQAPNAATMAPSGPMAGTAAGGGYSANPLHPGGQSSVVGGPVGVAGSAAAPMDLERFVGISEHEESLEAALRRQLEEGIVKSGQALETQGAGVRGVASVAGERLQGVPPLDFKSFDKAFASFQIARESLEKLVRDGQALHRDMERQLHELGGARPSSVDPRLFKERLLAAERIAAEVKNQKASLAEAEADLTEKKKRAETSASDARRASEELRRLEEEMSTLRIQKGEKDSTAIKLRHRANTPNLEGMKQQAAEAVERNLAEAKHLQVVGQRVQQGDPDYLREGENRDQKIAELSQKLQQLKRQHQTLLQQQKDLDIDPISLGAQAQQLENEAADLQARADALEARRYETERLRADKSSSSTRDAEDVRFAQERRSSTASRVAQVESEARRLTSELQPLIQEHHAGWQRLLSQQKRLDSDRHALSSRIDEANRAVDLEESARGELASNVQGLIHMLTGLQSFLSGIPSNKPVPIAVAAPPLQPVSTLPAANAFAATPSPADDIFREDFTQPAPRASPADDLFREDFQPEPARPSPADDIFREDFQPEPARPPPADDIFRDDFAEEVAAPAPAPALAPAPAEDPVPAPVPVPTEAPAPAAEPAGAGKSALDDFDEFLKDGL